jgi:hypothetical protein
MWGTFHQGVRLAEAGAVDGADMTVCMEMSFQFSAE